MAGNDVRVRLTPEGVAEVQAALRAVQREARKANRETERGVGGLRRQLVSVRGILAGLGTGAAAVGLAGLGRGALQFADAMDEASQRTGVATETLSSLAIAAKTAGTSFESVEASLLRLPQTLDELRTGSAGTVAAFGQLQLTAEQFRGLGLDESLDMIASRFVGLPTATDKARIAVDLFGKRGAELIPLLDDIGTRGLGGLRAAAETTGAVVTTEFGAIAGATGDAADAMALSLQGISTQFLTGFLPVVLDVFDRFDSGLSESATSGLREFGAAAGRVLGGVIALFRGVGIAAVNAADIIGTTLITGVVTLGGALTGRLGQAAEFAERLGARNRDNVEDIKQTVLETIGAIDQLMNQDPTPRATARPQQGAPAAAPGPTESQVRAAAAARLAIVRQGLADEALVRNAAASRQAAADERALADGLITLEDYLDRRRAAVLAGAAAEAAALRSQIREVESQGGTDAATRAAGVASLLAQLTASEIAAAQALDELAATGEDRRAEGARTRLEIEQQLADLEGRKQEAARLALDLQTQALREQLTAAGATRAQVDATVGRFRAANEARIGFEAIVDQAEAALGELDTARTRIEQDVELGISTQLGGQTRILEIERARLPVLQALAESLRQAAIATGDPAAIAQAEALSQRVREIGVSVDLAANSFARFRDQAEQSAVGALTDFLDNGITQAKSLKDAFRSMAASVINDLKRIAAQALATSIVRGLSGAFGGGATGAATGGLFDRGGLLRGPGTSTSDSIPAWLSRGEYVVRASSVRRPGTLAMLEAINSGRAPAFARGGLADIMPRFATGGLVEAGGATSAFRGRLEVGLADGLESRATPVSDGLIIDVIRRNPRRIGEILR